MTALKRVEGVPVKRVVGPGGFGLDFLGRRGDRDGFAERSRRPGGQQKPRRLTAEAMVSRFLSQIT